MRSSGWRVDTFDSARSLLDCASVREIAFLIADVCMPGMSGIELHRELLTGGYAPPVIFITAYATAEMARRAVDAGGLALLQKPFDLALLSGWLKYVLESI
ncbi:response regulator transcription factor [Burkholderia pyrrocinia]|uniref:response regulator transcription factor n=1 Tax=Burkholderia pyrrocinia TaxID=60550 RepID=UPI001EE6BC50|nr:response regulator [Burkholderia pyrrocinia]